MTDGEKVEYTVFVRNISFTTTGATLSREFGKYGPVKNVRIITRWNGTDRVSRGFGFVEFAGADRELMNSVLLKHERLCEYIISISR
jgi:RNA recognition motif-containing protein